MKFKKLVIFILASVLGITLFSGCAKDDASEDETMDLSSLSGTYVFVAKDMQNPYMQKVYEGFDKACNEIGVHPLYLGPEAPTAQKQIDIISNLIELNVSGIAIAANDADALQPVLTEAMDAGIKVISLDSAVNKDARQVHIQQASPEKIGRFLIQAAYEMIDGEGGIAILSSTSHATNQNLWIEWMHTELAENPEKYAKTPIVKIAYGDDDPTKSASETQVLLSDPSIKVIISPTTVGIQAAAKVICDNNSDVKLTGLGLPSTMATYIENGTCPWMYLWNPIDIGYLAGYTLDALINDKITGEAGGTFSAGSFGEKTVTLSEDGGTEVILGDPFRFDSSNIEEWKSVY